jgi:hypothetical protein
VLQDDPESFAWLMALYRGMLSQEAEGGRHWGLCKWQLASQLSLASCATATGLPAAPPLPSEQSDTDRSSV